jgi:choline dehydrogenase
MGLRYTSTGSDETNDMQMYMWSQDAEFTPQLRLIVDSQYLFMLCVTLQRPKSAGRVCLATASPDEQPLIDINLLDDPEDERRMADGVRRAWGLLTLGPIARMTESILSPTAEVVADDEALHQLLHERVTHLVHPVGTCKMGPASDRMAVVDAEGRVHGMDGLRVVDASIMPNIPRANTNLTAIMIGERVAAMMR